LSWREFVFACLHLDPQSTVLSHLDRDEDIPHASLETFGLQTTGSRLASISTVWNGVDSIEAWMSSTHHSAPVEKRNLMF
jgi:hypothetical protein